MKKHKKWISAVLFLGLMFLTIYVVFRKQNVTELWEAVRRMNKWYIFFAALVSVFFTSIEGGIIWYLLRVFGDKTRLITCLKYAFVGFFYSGVTPSATGGQPMQLYYMNKDGHRIADSSVALMCVAISYKLILVFMGAGLCVFWQRGLQRYLGRYLWLYYLGLFLNTILVVVLLAVMLNSSGIERFLKGCEKLLVRIRLLKPSDRRQEQIHTMIDQYKETVDFLKMHGRVVVFLLAISILQRLSVFFVTYLIYRGLGLQGTGAFAVMALQAVVYITVDMLPLPGSQGITELVYAAVYRSIFTGSSLTVSMCLTRGMNFYMLMILGAAAATYCWWGKRKSGCRG